VVVGWRVSVGGMSGRVGGRLRGKSSETLLKNHGGVGSASSSG
jgi:hypothetical protein